MPIRLSGLNSGLDTEALVSALVTSYSEKKKKYEKSQQKLSWTQDAWKSVNTSVHDLYTKASSLRFSSAYTMKKTNVSDSTKASVKAGASTPNGTQTLKVTDLAQAGYLTGGQLSGSVKGSTKLSDLGVRSSGTINILQNGKTKEISVDGDTTVDSFINKMKDAGLNASFDEKNQRIFISAKESGKDNDFSITAGDSNGLSVLSKLGLIAGNDSATTATYEGLKKLGETYTDTDSLKTALTVVRDAYKSKADAQTEMSALDTHISAAKAYKTIVDAKGEFDDETYNTFRDYAGMADADKTYAGTDGVIYKKREEVKDDDGNVTGYKYYNEEDGNKTYYGGGEGTEVVGSGFSTVAEKTAKMAEEAGVDLEAYKKALKEWGNYSSDTSGTLDKANEIIAHETNLASYIGNAGDTTGDSLYAQRAALQEAITQADTTIEGYSSLLKYSDSVSASTSDEDIEKFASSLMSRIQTASEGLEAAANSSARKVNGSDARIYLNDVEYTSTSNDFSVNGLSITALAKTGTKDDEGITITTNNDVQGLYDKVKDFLSQYNEVINDIYAQYNAVSSRGYEPLSEEEKEAMSDKQVEKWEEKIKSSLLRRDTTLGGIINTMTSAMASSFEINGEKYSLASFGIKTLGYFASSKNENYSYHIDGDEDDTAVSGNSDKLMAAISKDPDSVIEFMKQLTDGLYKGLDKKMKATTMRSAYTIYNDKEMASEYSDYTSLIKKWDDRLKSMEDSYFKKFAKMESALSTLQQSTSALTGMLGR